VYQAAKRPCQMKMCRILRTSRGAQGQQRPRYNLPVANAPCWFSHDYIYQHCLIATLNRPHAPLQRLEIRLGCNFGARSSVWPLTEHISIAYPAAGFRLSHSVYSLYYGAMALHALHPANRTTTKGHLILLLFRPLPQPHHTRQ